MTRRPQVPGLSAEWAQHQLALPPVCDSCTLVMTKDAHVGQAWECDPDRPGCPLHDVPELSR